MARPSDGIWQRRRRLIAPPADHAWWRSHAQAPTPLVIGPSHWRVYFAARDAANRSRIVFVDIDPGDDMRVLGPASDPVLELGAAGQFDADGQGPASVLRHDGRIYLFYSGIRRRSDVPHGIASGLAVSEDDGASFRRVTDTPILESGAGHAFHASMPFVERCGDGFSAWYMRGLTWEAGESGGTPRPTYDLVRAVSRDGLSWDVVDQPVLGLGEGERGLARPWVWTADGQRRLSYASRRDAAEPGTGECYRMMSVELGEGDRPVGTRTPILFQPEPEPIDWDGQSQTYAAVMPLSSGAWAMLYSGSDYGRDGFGWATIGVPEP